MRITGISQHQIVMMNSYDKTDKWSIFEFSKQLLGKTLEEVVAPVVIDPKRGKGQLGQLVEVYFFGIDNNSRQEADFPEAGLELKVTPLKELKDKTLAIKERLVCTMIDFTKDQSVPFEQSHIYLKCAYMLIPFYLHKDGVPVQRLKFIYDILWQIPEKDLLIMKQDYEKIIAKIKAGKAHELSEGDTTYLGACRKGQKGDADVPYTLLDGTPAAIPAPKRAFSLKTQYMRTVLEFAKKSGERGAYNTSAIVHGYKPHLIEESELREKSFEDILLDRFGPYYEMSYDDLAKVLHAPITGAKSKYFLVANEILTECHQRGEDVTQTEEFRKSGIVIKTIRLNKNGRPAEAMSFENINYFDIIEEAEWYESRLYDIFTSRFLFIVFQEDMDSIVRLKKAFFWTMPTRDLDDAAKYWLNIKNAVKSDHIAPEYFYREGDHKKFHVRPKGKNAADVTVNPNGGTVKKYCYWFNHDYIKSIVENAE